MRGRIVIFIVVSIITLIGCTPTSTPIPLLTATASPTSTVTPIPSATPSPSPTPDLRVINAQPESLMLTLEEAGLESTHIISNCEAREVVDEDPEVGVLMSEWSCNFLALNSNLSTSLLLGVDVHSASRAAIDTPVLSPSHASHLRDLAIGDRGAVLQQSSERPDGVIWHQYSVVFSYRNIFVFLSAGTEATSEELIDWLTDIAHLQYTKLQSMPLAAEFLADW